MNSKRILIFSLLIFLSISLATPVFIGTKLKTKGADPLQAVLPPYITNYTLFQGDPSLFRLAAQNNLTVSLPFFDSTIELQPVERSLLADDFSAMIVDENGITVEEPKQRVTNLQGSIKDKPNSKITITITNDSINGILYFGKTPFIIESLNQYTDDPNYLNYHLIYPNRFLNTEYYERQAICESIKIKTLESPETTRSTSSGGTLLCRIALACDLEFYNLYPSNWAIQMITVINGIDHIYRDQIDTAFSVTKTIAILSGLTTNNSWLLVFDFKEAMRELDKSTYIPRDVAHLFSGKNFDGVSIGRACEPGLNNEWAYGVSQHIAEPGTYYSATLYDRQIVVAHEIGHNFNGSHDYADYWYLPWPIARYSIMWSSYMGPFSWPAFSDGTGILGNNNSERMRNYASGRLVDWSPGTYPKGKDYNFAVIDFDYLGGMAYHIDTIGSSQYGYAFFGYTSSHTYRVRPDGTLSFTGWFRQFDAFKPPDQPGRRRLFVYALSPITNNILGSKEILNYLNGTDWHYIEDTFQGLMPGLEVRFAIGRPDSWSYDWQLTAEWAGVTVYGQYSGRTSPTGKHYRFYEISTVHGDGYHIDTKYSNDYGYYFYGYTGQFYTVSEGGWINITGWFRQFDTFSDELAPGRRKTLIFLLDMAGNILDSQVILEWYDNISYFHESSDSFDNLSAGSYRIGIGRPDSWSCDYVLTVEWSNVNITKYG